jgi:hypothetical protein
MTGSILYFPFSGEFERKMLLISGGGNHSCAEEKPKSNTALMTVCFINQGNQGNWKRAY